MNAHSNTTAPVTPAMPDFKAAFDGLEGKVYRLQSFAAVLAYLAMEDIDRLVDGQYRVSENVGDMVKFLSVETELAADDLVSSWLETHNARCDAEMAARRAGRAA